MKGAKEKGKQEEEKTSLYCSFLSFPLILLFGVGIEKIAYFLWLFCMRVSGAGFFLFCG